jgi:hypothetical protein
VILVRVSKGPGDVKMSVWHRYGWGVMLLEYRGYVYICSYPNISQVKVSGIIA